jgi:hypothetical protein
MPKGTPKRDTEYALEIATARLPSGKGNDTVAIEHLYVKDAAQHEIRFSWWKGTRMMDRPLDLPESELLPLFREAIKERVFSEEFLADLRRLLDEERPA